MITQKAENRGKYIVIEGSEYAGKSTQTLALSKRLREEALLEVMTTFEPGATPFGAQIRNLVLGSEDRSPMANLFLMTADRAQLADTLIRPSLENGRWVVSDRNWFSSLAYQGFGEGCDIDDIESLAEVALNELAYPDLAIVLSIDEAETARRLPASYSGDFFESKAGEFHRRVSEGYKHIIDNLGSLAIDGSGEIETVHERIWDEVKPLTGTPS